MILILILIRIPFIHSCMHALPDDALFEKMRKEWKGSLEKVEKGTFVTGYIFVQDGTIVLVDRETEIHPTISGFIHSSLMAKQNELFFMFVVILIHPLIPTCIRKLFLFQQPTPKHSHRPLNWAITRGPEFTPKTPFGKRIKRWIIYAWPVVSMPAVLALTRPCAWTKSVPEWRASCVAWTSHWPPWTLNNSPRSWINSNRNLKTWMSRCVCLCLSRVFCGRAYESHSLRRLWMGGREELRLYPVDVTNGYHDSHFSTRFPLLFTF